MSNWESATEEYVHMQLFKQWERGLEDPVLGRKGTWLVAYTRILMKTTKRVWWSHYLLVSKSILFTIVWSKMVMGDEIIKIQEISVKIN